MKRITQYAKENSRLLIVFTIAISLSFIFIKQLSFLLLKIGNTIDYEESSFRFGYFIIVLLFIVIYSFLIKKNYIHNKRTTFLVFYVTIIYCFLRVIFTGYIQFSPINRIFVYADFVLLLAIMHFINLVKDWTKKRLRQKNNENKDKDIFFIEDNLFKNGKIDNERILQRLKEVLINLKPKEAFSIGINAIWGYGKSSFLHRFEEEYKSDNQNEIIFWYCIWKNKGSTAIIENFFEELKNQLSPYSSQISDDINNYVESILSLTNSELHKLISTGKEILTENKTLEGYFDNINTNIKKIDKQIIILLDDMDRLEQDEIMNTFKLIRTLSDFNNVIFIAGYDREYIVKTIKNTNDNYLDKVFNVEINLLPFDHKLINDEIIKHLEVAFPSKQGVKDKKGFSDSFMEIFIAKELEIDQINLKGFLPDDTFICNDNILRLQDFILTYRDVKRFINEFKFNASLSDIEKEVNAEEYLLLKLLLYKYRKLQNLIFNDIDNLFAKGRLGQGKDNIYYFGHDKTGDIYVYNESVKEKINILLLENNFTNKSISIINAVLCRLFSEKPSDYYIENQNSITKIYYTNIYLRNNIAGIELTTSEIIKAYNSNTLIKIVKELNKSVSNSKYQLLNEIKTYINKKIISDKTPINNKQFEDILQSLNIIITYLSIEDSLLMLKIIKFGFANLYSTKKQFYTEFQLLINVDYIGSLDNLLSNINRNIKRKDNDSSSYSENEIVNYEENIFEKLNLKNLLLGKLKFLIKSDSNPKIILDVYLLYIEKIVLDKNILFSKEANNLLKEDIIKRKKEYLESLVFENLIKESTNSFIKHNGYTPDFFFSQIFSNNNTLSSLLSEPNNKSLFNTLHNEGWENFNRFIQELNMSDFSTDKKRLSKIKRTMKVFLEYDFNPISFNEYNKIWKED